MGSVTRYATSATKRRLNPLVDPVCGGCVHINLSKKVDSHSTRFVMNIYECVETAQYVSRKRVICGKFEARGSV
jgi:hypothetical protein